MLEVRGGEIQKRKDEVAKMKNFGRGKIYGVIFLKILNPYDYWELRKFY